MGIVITKAGWQTMVMDQGRQTTRHLGIPSSGVTDLFQYWWANGLVNNYDFKDSGPPVLEIGTGPVEVLFDEPHTFALTGSAGDYFLDDKKLPPYKPVQAKKNQTLRLENIHRNGTAYLAIGGKWKADRVYASASADILSPFPGTTGKVLEDHVQIGIQPQDESSSLIEVTPEYIKRSTPVGIQTLRLTAGPELGQCDTIKHSLMEDTFTISRNSSKMGYRLENEKKVDLEFSSMISSIVLPGVIQWPSGGEPIILLPNCQTTGGYPRVAKVIDADMWKLAYLGPGDQLQFKWTTREEALYLRNYKMNQFEQFWNDTFPNLITNYSLSY